MDFEEEPQYSEEDIMLSVDEIIERYVGGFGGAQLFQVGVLALGLGFDAQNTFLPIFTDAQPSWRCTIAKAQTETCTAQSSICEMDPRVWEWERGKEASIISEWDLICANSFKAGVPELLFFIGALLGCIMLGPLADSSVGRKRMLLLSSFTLSVTGVLTGLSPNIWIYSLLRAFSGFGRAPIVTCCLLLSTEIVRRKWRGLIGFLLFFSCTLGFLSLPALAYLTQLHFSWRRTYIYLSILPLAYSLFLLPLVWESPRWLLLRPGKSNEALQSLKKMAELNGRSLPENVRIEDCTAESHRDSALSLLWTTKWARRRLGLTMAVGFGMGLLYYGMPLGSGNLEFNLYLSVTFNALSEIPGAIISTVLVAKAGRRRAILVLSLTSGVFCFVCAFQGVDHHRSGNRNWWQMGAELGALMSAVTAFNVLLIYCLELFPSSVRNSAMSMLRQAINVGAIVSPVIVVTGHSAPYLSFVIFGISIIMSGLFVLGLPETKDRPLYDTLEGQLWQENECKTSSVAPLLS